MLYERALAVNPDDFLCLSNLAVVYDKTSDLDKFYAAAKKLHDLKPKDLGAINTLAVAEYRLGMFKKAIERLKEAILLHPNSYETHINLSSIGGDLLGNKEQLEIALHAVGLRPTEAAAHVNLGSTFMLLGRSDDAATCFETALELDPKNQFAMTNLAVLSTRGNNYAQAIVMYEKLLTEPDLKLHEEKRLRFFLGLAYLTLGNLSRGWSNYAFGFLPESKHGRNPVRRFKVPEWTGENKENKTLLVWREQGLGDELFFFSALPELENYNLNVIVESDVRLVPILRRSFPKFKIRPQAYYDPPEMTSPFNDFDFHCPAGNLFAHFRPDLASFESSKGYLQVDEGKRDFFERRLGPRNGSLRLGICWRSGVLQALRNANYTSLSDWAPILSLKNTQFVNLQYGDTEKERLAASRELKVFINHWPDLDLRDDLDNTAALCSCLDLVVSVGTASAQLALASGVETITLTRNHGWTAFGSKTNLVYPNGEFLVPSDEERSLQSVISALSSYLSSYISSSTGKDGFEKIKAKQIVKEIRHRDSGI